MTRTIIALIVVVLTLGLASIALADENYFLSVDGVLYSPDKISGSVRHYNTPDMAPHTAFSDRHEWVGHGSENLPCPFGIHWVDNKNVLTVSHCLEGETTTTTSTTVPRTTTTTITEETTTTETPTTTTTVVDTTTTTTSDSTTTTEDSETTTTVAVTVLTLPNTGMVDGLIGLGLIAGALLAIGAIFVYAGRNDE